MQKTLIKVVDLNCMSDGRGDLVALEGNQNVPFAIKRVYYLTNLQAEHPRGYHAHQHLRQLLICVHGSFDLVLDDGERKEKIHLNKPTQGVLIQSMVWREMHSFSHDCVIVVLASELYDEADYIRDYDSFLKEVRR